MNTEKEKRTNSWRIAIAVKKLTLHLLHGRSQRIDRYKEFRHFRAYSPSLLFHAKTQWILEVSALFSFSILTTACYTASSDDRHEGIER